MILEINPLADYSKADASVLSMKEEIWNRLNFIKDVFGNRASFEQWVAPSKMRKLFREQHKKLSDALDVLRSFSGPNMGDAQVSREPNLSRRWLYEVAEINPAISAGLIGYDVTDFDRNFSTAIESLERIEGYFSSVLLRAESSVKRQGKNKPESSYVDNLLGSLCHLYRDITGEIPSASVDDITATVRGKIIKFLEIVLREFPYPNTVTPMALEIKIRRLKNHEMYAHLWEDTKR